MSPEMNSHTGAQKAKRITVRLGKKFPSDDLISELKNSPHGIKNGYETITLSDSRHLKIQAEKSRRRSKNRTSRSWWKVGDSIRVETQAYRDALGQK